MGWPAGLAFTLAMQALAVTFVWMGLEELLPETPKRQRLRFLLWCVAASGAWDVAHWGVGA